MENDRKKSQRKRLKNNRGARTWSARSFDGKKPSLDHPLVQKAIEIEETGL